MKIGIIGSESNHALDFSKICGKFDVESVIDDCLKVSSDLDGVMIVSRDGNVHKNLALPFIDAGIPVFVDKPLTIKPEDAKEITELAKFRKTPLTGGSTCKFSPELITLRERVKSGKFGKISSISLGFPVLLDSPYNGFHFYSHHLIEMMLTIFGFEVRSVKAFEKNGNVICVAVYEGLEVVLNFFKPGIWDGYVVIFGTDAREMLKYDLPASYEAGVCAFLDMIMTRRESISHDKLIFPVQLSAAIEKSFEENIEVNISFKS